MATLSSPDAPAAEIQDVAPFHKTQPELNPRGQQTGNTLPIQPPLSAHGSMDIVYVGSPYSPCTRTLRDLEPILLADLTINHHYRGSLLLVKLVSTVEAGRTITIANIEDTSGDTALLIVNLAFMDTSSRGPRVGRNSLLLRLGPRQVL